MPNRRKITLPPSANAVRVMAQVQAPRRAMRRRTAGTSRWVIARNVGTAGRGATMKRTDVKIRNSSWSVFTIPSERHPHDAVLASALGFVHPLLRPAEQLVGPRFPPRPPHDA